MNGITGIDGLNRENVVSLYPNPTGSLVTIQTQQALRQATIRLTNIMGQLIQEYTDLSGSQFFINLSSYSVGIYMVEVAENGNAIRTKVVKQ